ncbi:hypothetical protein EYZ11_004038 [Aspergillus tanneri]|uniref:glucan 1,4-alpha-glucosidase n=1 Tax=Aspergillus tanneri TaxID=1220188 RepID=A0A4V3UPU3_9EURO|nr:hypothetical protein EYZ11_004038 [Aspergillus tanneri]
MLVSVLVLSLFRTANASPAQIVLSGTTRSNPSLDSWLLAEIPEALDGVLNNIGADGAKATGARSGSVVASPNTKDPNYYYTWTRDAALTARCLVDIVVSSADPTLQSAVQDYISFQADLQAVSNPSGGLLSGGLGEPKFNVDGSAFTDSWGRPQRDGPALRAMTLMAYSNWLIDRNQSSLAQTIWPIIRNDLSYVSEYWNSSTYDLWEEQNGSSFFTSAVQYRALSDGASLADRLNLSCPNCLSQAPQTLCFLQYFWSPSDAFILSNLSPTASPGPNVTSPRSGKDINSILASIHTFNPTSPCDDTTFQPCSSRALANLKSVVDAFRPLYDINRGIPSSHAIALGRYPEDVYQGGHPWYLCTLAAAQLLYQAVSQWKYLGFVTIERTSLAFFRDVYPSARVGSYPSSERVYAEILDAVMVLGDGYLGVVQKYTPSNGALAEQFSRDSGAPVSATDLTWSPLGEDVFLVGSVTQLGEWDVNRAVPLDAHQYGVVSLWFTRVSLPVGMELEYKFFMRVGGKVVWESGLNRELQVRESCKNVSMNAVWRD